MLQRAVRKNHRLILKVGNCNYCLISIIPFNCVGKNLNFCDPWIEDQMQSRHLNLNRSIKDTKAAKAIFLLNIALRTFPFDNDTIDRSST